MMKYVNSIFQIPPVPCDGVVTANLGGIWGNCIRGLKQSRQYTSPVQHVGQRNRGKGDFMRLPGVLGMAHESRQNSEPPRPTILLGTTLGFCCTFVHCPACDDTPKQGSRSKQFMRQDLENGVSQFMQIVALLCIHFLFLLSCQHDMEFLKKSHRTTKLQMSLSSQLSSAQAATDHDLGQNSWQRDIS